MKTTYKLSPFVASLITHCYDSARATQQYAREIIADKQTPDALKFAFTDVAATLRSPIERIERGIPSVKQQEFKEQIQDADPLIFQNIQYLYSRMTKEQKELLELSAEHILKGGAIEFEQDVKRMEPIRLDDKTIMEKVISFISEAKGISIEKMESSWRKREVCYCRQLCIYVIKHKTVFALEAIGNRFGGRDHTTAGHSINTIKDLMDTDENVRADVEYFMSIDYANYEGELKQAV